MAAHITRRGLMVAAGAAAVVPAVSIGRHARAQRAAWTALIASLVNQHPNAAAALRMAIDMGVDPRSFYGAALTGAREDHLPALFFGDERTVFTVVMPHEAQVVRKFL